MVSEEKRERIVGLLDEIVGLVKQRNKRAERRADGTSSEERG